MADLGSLTAEFEKFWPGSHAEEWDRVGLLAGSKGSHVDTVLVSVDLTEAVIEEALKLKAQLIVTHHPFLLKPIVSVADDQLKGKLLGRLIRNNVAVFSAHTNADVQTDGASTLMATAFGLQKLEPLASSMGGFGHGVIGELPEDTTLDVFAARVAEQLPSTARKVAFAGNPQAKIRKVAVCSGAGDSFIPIVLASDADVYVTSDLRHHPTQDAVATPRETGQLSLIDVAHWAAESLWVNAAVQRIESIGTLKVLASAIKTDPWTQEVNPNA